jgi:hypothetical protein
MNIWIGISILQWIAISGAIVAWLYFDNKKSKRIQNTLGPIEGQVEFFYEDSLGNKWYQFVNPVQLATHRSISMEIAHRYQEMNLTRSQLQKYLIRMKRNAEAGKVVELFTDLLHLEERINYACEEETLISLACAYFMLEGEPADQITDFWTKKKREIFEKDEKTRGFFLLAAYRLTKSYSEVSESDILTYLMKHRLSSVKAPRPKSPVIT